MSITASVTSGTTYWLVYDTNVDAGQGTANGLDFTNPSSGNTHFFAGWTFGTTGAGTTNGFPNTISGATVVSNLAESIYASASAGPALTINNSGQITTQTTFQNTANS